MRQALTIALVVPTLLATSIASAGCAQDCPQPRDYLARAGIDQGIVVAAEGHPDVQQPGGPVCTSLGDVRFDMSEIVDKLASSPEQALASSVLVGSVTPDPVAEVALPDGRHSVCVVDESEPGPGFCTFFALGTGDVLAVLLRVSLVSTFDVYRANGFFGVDKLGEQGGPG